MAKQGMHKDDINDQTKSKGGTPSQSMDMTSGSCKKPDTYRVPAMRGQATHKQGQNAKSQGWNERPGRYPDTAQTRARHVRSGRSGSDSNAT